MLSWGNWGVWRVWWLRPHAPGQDDDIAPSLCSDLLALHPGSAGRSTPAEAPCGHLGNSNPGAPHPKSKPGAERARFTLFSPSPPAQWGAGG